MDHNTLDIIGDFIAPLSEFLDNFGIVTHNNVEESKSTKANTPDQKKPKKSKHNPKDIHTSIKSFDENLPTEKQLCTEESCLLLGEISEDDDDATILVKSALALKKPSDKKQRFVLYRGPNLIIENIFFENPKTVVEKAKAFVEEVNNIQAYK